MRVCTSSICTAWSGYHGSARNARNPTISVETLNHGFPQISVIAHFEPARGSHLDSANCESPLLPVLGADDGGSGTVTILVAFRALVRAGFRPKVPAEFHWYAGEEGRLLCSQDIVSEHLYQRKDIGAMIQFVSIAGASSFTDMSHPRI